jgi:hypothetical protein
MIGSVGEKEILQFHDVFGGPKPPPIDHEGIDDIFLEKGSRVYYCVQGEWLKLQGGG